MDRLNLRFVALQVVERAFTVVVLSTGHKNVHASSPTPLCAVS